MLTRVVLIEVSFEYALT